MRVEWPGMEHRTLCIHFLINTLLYLSILYPTLPWYTSIIITLPAPPLFFALTHNHQLGVAFTGINNHHYHPPSSLSSPPPFSLIFLYHLHYKYFYFIPLSFIFKYHTLYNPISVSYTHLRAHETPEHLVCRLLLEKKKKNIK
eukprot:TRINITY_DN13662_c0_g1_i1.p1 TRINITY_DN13662_c0_g1~~TRINITY_DN13662_c0_g1_i1.p1  ORF type:complete len:143 (-),score=15.12 TRINITY_DN13662_c0_g1_i1:106-534(-)